LNTILRICPRFSGLAVESAAVVSVDGFGDFASAAWGVAHSEIKIQGRVFFPHSLGVFYQAVTNTRVSALR
jgi:predicted NodU family carbamoyl transferase